MSAQLAFDLRRRPALDADDFLIAPCNQDAVAWLDHWPNWPAPLLTLYGPRACGKTHLAHVWRNRSRAVFLKLDAVSKQSPYDALGDNAACIIENVDGGDALDETALFHLYNAARDKGGHILLTATTAPATWTLNLPDLRSRLVAAPTAAIGAPDDAVLGGVLVKLFQDRQLRVEPDVLSYILIRMERSFDAALAIVDALDTAAMAAQRTITIPFARKIL
ncbi:MAG: DNA replication protein [Alphaproteobacteria bacterium]|nr:DNA replication protein [Alphaproteobacteria bacterium]